MVDEQVDLEEVYRSHDLVLYRTTVAGTGRVGTARTVHSIGEYIDGVEAGTIGTPLPHVEVKIIDINTRDRKIALSMKALLNDGGEDYREYLKKQAEQRKGRGWDWPSVGGWRWP